MRLRRVVVFAAALVTVACGKKLPPPFQFDGSITDAGDAGGSDASVDSAVDARVDAGPVACTATRIPLLSDANGAALELAVAGGADGFLVTWTETRSTVAGAYARFVPSLGTEGPEQPLTTSVGTIQAPAVSATPAGFVMSYADNGPGSGFDVDTLGFETNGAQATTPFVTSTMSSMQSDDLPALAFHAKGALAVWNQTTASPTVSTSLVRAIVPSAIVPVAASSSVGVLGNPTGRVSLVPFGQNDGYLLGFVGSDSKLRAQPLDASGAVMGGPLTLSASLVTSRFELAGSRLAAAGVWEVVIAGSRHEVHMQRLDSSLKILSSEIDLDPVDQGRAPSIAPIAGGYVVAMRAKVAGVTKLRVLFIDDFDTHVIDTVDYDTLIDDDGLVRVRVDHNGRILVVYADDAANGAHLTALRLDCVRQ